VQPVFIGFAVEQDVEAMVKFQWIASEWTRDAS
jgi:hypothetical protein